MLEKENKNKVLRFRLTETDYEIFSKICECLQLAPSQYLRMLVNATITPVKVKISNGDISLDNLQDYIDNLSK